jgi:redox-sensing transcriptional repressor
MDRNDISLAVIKRLPRYVRYLEELLDNGVERISSSDLSKRMNVTASQIRQDLNNFGGFGQQGYGYNVKFLHDEITKILGIDKVHSIVIVGAGNLGRALANYANFEKRGFVVKGMFDANPELIDVECRGAKVMPMSEMADFIRDNNIEILALTIPKTSATEVVTAAVEAGIKGIWNFAHIDLVVPDNVVVENVHLSESLMTLSYNIMRLE